MQRVAVTWHIYELTNSAVALGLLGASRLVPVLLLALPGGALADRVDRRLMMLFSTAVMALASVLLWVCTISHGVNATVVYLAVGLGAAAHAFNGPARQAMIPNLVPAGQLQPALTLSLLTWDVAGMTGPALGGLVLAYWGPAPIYLFDAVTYGAVIAALLMMRTRAIPAAQEGPVGSIQNVMDGIRFVFGNRLIASSMFLDFFATLFGQATVLFPIFARDVLHVGAEGLGLMYSAPAVGSVTTGVMVALLPPMRRQGAVLMSAVSAYGVATVVFGVSTHLVLTLLALALSGGADTVSTVVRQTLRQRLTPDEMRGRMTGVNMIFFIGGPQLGELESGLLAAALGPAAAVVLGGGGVLITVLLTAWWVPALRRYRDNVAGGP
jgi:MFS family permease